MKPDFAFKALSLQSGENDMHVCACGRESSRNPLSKVPESVRIRPGDLPLHPPYVSHSRPKGHLEKPRELPQPQRADYQKDIEIIQSDMENPSLQRDLKIKKKNFFFQPDFEKKRGWVGGRNLSIQLSCLAGLGLRPELAGASAHRRGQFRAFADAGSLSGQSRGAWLL